MSKFKVGDHVEFVKGWSFLTGGVRSTREVGDRGVVRSLHYFDSVILEGFTGSEFVFEAKLKLVPAPNTYTLTHKTNGATLTVTSDEYHGAAWNENHDTPTFGALIEGTTEPVVQFKYGEWDVIKVKTPFVLPTKRSAIVELDIPGQHIKGFRRVLKLTNPNDEWGYVMSNGVGSRLEVVSSKFVQKHATRVIFEGLDD